jgi:hypothetical protein
VTPGTGASSFASRIYEKDRLDPVSLSAEMELDPTVLARFPEGYRHLAYKQTRIGYTVKPDMPGLKGSEVERLYQRGVAGGRQSLTPIAPEHPGRSLRQTVRPDPTQTPHPNDPAA